MVKKGDEFGKFVRLNLVGEIVEVVDADETEIVVKFFGHILTMKHREVSRISPEEAAAVERRISH